MLEDVHVVTAKFRFAALWDNLQLDVHQVLLRPFVADGDDDIAEELGISENEYINCYI